MNSIKRHIKKAMAFATSLLLLTGLMQMATGDALSIGDGYPGAAFSRVQAIEISDIQPAVGIAPLSVIVVTDEQGLRNAIAGSPASVHTVIEVNNTIELAWGAANTTAIFLAAIEIPNGRDITIQGSGELVVTGAWRHFVVRGALTLEDSITLTRYSGTAAGGGVDVRGGGTFTMNGGAITGNAGVFNVAGNGGGVHVTAVGGTGGGTFIMNGGEITHNVAGDTFNGGGVFVAGNGSSFVMNNGLIEGNQADNGGGVRAEGLAAFTMNGGTIIDNTANYSGGGVWLGGGVAGTSTLHTMSGGVIEGNNAPNGGGVTVNNPGAAFSMSGDARIHGHSISNNGGGVHVMGSATLNMSGNAQIFDNIAGNSGGGVFLTATSNFYMDGNVQVKNNEAAHGGGVFLQTGSIFTLTRGLIAGNTAINGGGVSVRNPGSIFTMNGGRIGGRYGIDVEGNTYDNRNSATNGGGVESAGNGGRFILNNGEIIGNTAAINGGGVSVMPNSDFTMRNGEIRGNEASGNGGGVNILGTGAIAPSTLTLSGGIIENNGAVNGGGVFATGNNWNFDMDQSDAAVLTRISDNEASNNGGGVFVDSGIVTAINAAFTMSSGEITDNTASYGGGIFVMATAALNVASGRITGNTAELNGGGIAAVRYDNIQISAGTIFAGNTASVAHNLLMHANYPDIVSNVPAAYSGVPGGLGGNASHVGWSGVSVPSTHALNNYDINFTGRQLGLYTVVFHGNGGNVLPQNERRIVYESRSLSDMSTMPPPPVRPGYSFDGWIIMQSGENVRFLPTTDVTSAMVDENGELHVFARWIRLPLNPERSQPRRTHPSSQITLPQVTIPPQETHNPQTGR